MLGKHHSEATKKLLSDQRKGIVPSWMCGKNSHLYGKVGSLNPQWKGGITPERERLYKTKEWKKIYRAVLERDKFKCVYCNTPIKPIQKGNKKVNNLCVHHIASFTEYKDLQCDVNNLVLLCRKCHYWVHSSKNVDKKYLL